MREKPNDRRGFVHGRIVGAIGGFIGGGPGGAISGFIGGGGGGEQLPQLGGSAAQQIPGWGQMTHHQQHLAIESIPKSRRPRHRKGHFFTGAGSATSLAPASPSGDGCLVPGMRRDPNTGECAFFLGDQIGPEPGGVGGGQVVAGRYGAGMVPDIEMRRHRECLPGMVLGNDGVCYNRRDIKNAEREWPKGRAPLLTGGERNAITKASRAARKIERTTKQLQKMGMLAKPAPRKKAAPKMAPYRGPGVQVIDTG